MTVTSLQVIKRGEGGAMVIKKVIVYNCFHHLSGSRSKGSMGGGKWLRKIIFLRIEIGT